MRLFRITARLIVSLGAIGACVAAFLSDWLGAGACIALVFGAITLKSEKVWSIFLLSSISACLAHGFSIGAFAWYVMAPVVPGLLMSVAIFPFLWCHDRTIATLVSACSIAFGVGAAASVHYVAQESFSLSELEAGEHAVVEYETRGCFFSRRVEFTISRINQNYFHAHYVKPASYSDELGESPSQIVLNHPVSARFVQRLDRTVQQYRNPLPGLRGAIAHSVHLRISWYRAGALVFQESHELPEAPPRNGGISFLFVPLMLDYGQGPSER